MLYYFTLGLGLIVTLGFVFVRSKGASVKRLFFKMSSSLCYLLTSVFAVISNPGVADYGTLIIMGGALGLAGDAALDLKFIYPKDANEYLKAGFLFFLVGHVFYVGAIILYNPLEWWHILICLAISVVLGVGTIMTANMMKLHYGKYRRIVMIYVIFLSMTATTSVLSAFLSHSKSMIILAVGAVSFLLSDLVLSKIYFGRDWEKPVPIFANHFLYYAGQYLIAASIIFLNK